MRTVFPNQFYNPYWFTPFGFLERTKRPFEKMRLMQTAGSNDLINSWQIIVLLITVTKDLQILCLNGKIAPVRFQLAVATGNLWVASYIRKVATSGPHLARSNWQSQLARSNWQSQLASNKNSNLNFLVATDR